MLGFYYVVDGFRLSGGNVNFIVRNMVFVIGNIYVDDVVIIILG